MGIEGPMRNLACTKCGREGARQVRHWGMFLLEAWFCDSCAEYIDQERRRGDGENI